MVDVKFFFEGKRFVVTGASGSIGSSLVSEIAEAGGKVLAIARGKDKLEALQEKYPQNVILAIADVCDYEAIEKAIESFVESNGKIDGACHLAGRLVMTPVKAYVEEEAKQLMDVNFWSGIKLIQLCNKKKISKDGSSYVFISSVCAYKGEAAQFAMNASKGALQVSVRTIAKEIYKRGSRINSISPGLIMTEMTKGDFVEKGISENVKVKHLLGLGLPSDVSGMVCYLLSDRARWITGQDFVVDGGYLVSD